MDIIIPYTGKNFVTDATLLTSIMKCGRFTDLNQNQSLHHINGKSNSLETGSIAHKYLEVKYASEKKGLSKSQAHGFGMTAAELYIQGCPDCTGFEPMLVTDVVNGVTKQYMSKPKCGHEINEYPGLQNTPAEPDKGQTWLIGWKWVLDTCEQYNEFYKNDFWVTLETEKVKSRIMYKDDDIRILFKSKLDWFVDTNVAQLPVDHKTMKQNRDLLKLNNQFKGQCLNTDSRNVIINKVGFQKTLKPAEKFKRETVSYTSSILYEWQSEILPYWCKLALQYEEQGYWPPNYSNCDGKYGKCTYTEVCEANPDMRSDVLKLNFIRGEKWNPMNAED